MQRINFGREMKKNSLVLLTIFGFAAFKAAQSMLYSTAVFMTDGSFILISGMEFSLLSALAVLTTEAIVVGAVFAGKMREWSLPIFAPAVLFLVVAALSFSGMLASLPLVVSLCIAAVAHGGVTVILTLAWVEVFFKLKAADAVRSLAAAMLLASVISLAMQGSGDVVRFVVTATLLMVGVLACWKARQKMILDVEECSNVAVNQPTKISKPSIEKHVRGLVSIGEGMISLLVLGCAVGIINGFMIREGSGFDGSSEASSLGTCLASIIFFIAVFSLPKVFSTAKAYRILFPLLTGILIAWPLVDFQYGYFFSIAFVVGHGFVATSVMYLIINEGSRRSLNPYAFMGISIFFIRLSSMVGLFVGASIAAINATTSFKTMLVIAVVIYLLSLVLLFMLRRRGRETPVEAPAVSDEEAFRLKTVELTSRYRLTPRESDILEHLSRGRTATYIGGVLYLSPNTVRGHIKSIYIKLDVHSKQELIDLFT